MFAKISYIHLEQGEFAQRRLNNGIDEDLKTRNVDFGNWPSLDPRYRTIPASHARS